MAEPYRRVFATLRPDGGFSLFSTIQPQPLLNTRLGAEVRQMAFAPRGDGLLLESAQGWQRYALDNPYPDVTGVRCGARCGMRTTHSRPMFGSPPPAKTVTNPNSV